LTIRGYLGLGSNRGNRENYLLGGRAGLERHGVQILEISSLFETDPVDCETGGPFLNQVLQVEFGGRPEELLTAALQVELENGRDRTAPSAGKNSPRTLDIDLLLFPGVESASQSLILPHPAMWSRAFVLVPLKQIVPGLRNPATGLTIEKELERLPDGEVHLYNPSPTG
jgi:2-amino-4-hydroxy-6-hydroxymethyldihydropteridine diphosphokinase